MSHRHVLGQGEHPGEPIPIGRTTLATGRRYCIAVSTKVITVSQPRDSRNVYDDSESIEARVAAIFASRRRGVVALTTMSTESATMDAELALERLRFRVEALAGFAAGAAVNATAKRTRRSIDAEDCDRVGVLLVRLAGNGSSAMAVGEIALSARFLADLDRRLLDELGPRGLRLLRLSSQSLPDLASALDRLAAAEAPELAIFDPRGCGWQHYTAEVSVLRPGRRPRADGKEREPRSWFSWTRWLHKRV